MLPEPARSAAHETSVTGLLAGWVAFGGFWGGWGALLPAVKAGTGSSDGQLGVALLCIAAAAPVMPLAGRAFDRIGSQLLPAALAGFAAAIALLGAAESPPQLMLLLAVLGAASGTADVALSAAVTSVEAARGAPLMAAAHATLAAAGLVGAAGVGAARDWSVGRLELLLALAGLVALAAVGNAGAPRRRPTLAPDGRSHRIPVSRALLLLGTLGGLAYLIENGLGQWSALQLETTLAPTRFSVASRPVCCPPR